MFFIKVLLAAVWVIGLVTKVHASVDINDGDVDFNAISTFSKTMFPGRLFNGVLCWKNDKIKQLSLKMNQQGLSFSNSKEVTFDMKSNIVFVDMRCNNLQIENNNKQKLLRNILFLNIATCDSLPAWNFQFSMVNIHIFMDNVFINCDKRGRSTPWKSHTVATWNAMSLTRFPPKSSQLAIDDQPIEVAFVASPSTIKNIKDFRRNLYTEVSNRFNYQLFNEIFKFLNLTPETSFIPDVTTPTSKAIIAFPQALSKDNLTTYDFLTSLTPNRNTFLMRAPSLSAVSNVFTLPLELNVWYASYVLIAVLFVTVFIIVRMEWKFPDMVPNKYRILYPKVMDVVQMHVGAIAQQGSEAEPTSGGGRIATFLIFLFFLFLYTAYSANIVALLGSTTKRVHGVKDLKDFNVKLGIDKDDFTKGMFQNQKSAEHRALFYEKLIKEDCYMTMDKGLMRMRNEFFAFHGDSDRIYKLIEKNFLDNEKCGFVEIQYLSESDLLVPIRKDSLLKEALKIGLALFLERGMHSRIKNIIFAKQPLCYSGGTNFVSVSLLDCYFAFVIYCGGTATAFVMFIVELVISRSKLKQLLKFGLNLRKDVDLQNREVDEGEQRLQSLSSTSTINYQNYID